MLLARREHGQFCLLELIEFLHHFITRFGLHRWKQMLNVLSKYLFPFFMYPGLKVTKKKCLALFDLKDSYRKSQFILNTHYSCIWFIGFKWKFSIKIIYQSSKTFLKRTDSIEVKTSILFFLAHGMKKIHVHLLFLHVYLYVIFCVFPIMWFGIRNRRGSEYHFPGFHTCFESF